MGKQTRRTKERPTVKKPSRDAVINFALNILQEQGIDVASALKQPEPRRVWTQPAKGHVFAAEWKKTQHKCPNCGHQGPVNPDFGLKLRTKRDGTTIEEKQSWCAECRSTTNYHVRERLVDRKAREARETLQGAINRRGRR